MKLLECLLSLSQALYLAHSGSLLRSLWLPLSHLGSLWLTLDLSLAYSDLLWLSLAHFGSHSGSLRRSSVHNILAGLATL